MLTPPFQAVQTLTGLSEVLFLILELTRRGKKRGWVQLTDRQITGELSLPSRFPPGVSYAPSQEHAPCVTLDPLNLTLLMNLKVVAIRWDSTKLWHHQQGSTGKAREGRWLFRSSTRDIQMWRKPHKVQQQQPVCKRQRWERSDVQRGGTAVCAQLAMQKQGTESSSHPPGESRLCRARSEERKEQIYTVFWENRRKKKREAESRLIGLFSKPESPRRAANKHRKQRENNEKWVKWNAKYWLRCWFSKGQWDNVTQLVV